jgi:hypothetical protein
MGSSCMVRGWWSLISSSAVSVYCSADLTTLRVTQSECGNGKGLFEHWNKLETENVGV